MALPLTYHWRNLFVRKTTTLLTVVLISAVVGVFCYMLGFARSIDESMSIASDPRKIVVIRNGATAESNSAIRIEDYNRLGQVVGLAVDPADSQPLQSPEMMVQVQCPRLSDGGATFSNVAIRGVTPKALKVHTNVRIVEGRMFDESVPEVIVGKAAASQFGGLRIGDELKLGYGGDRPYRVVGHFSADGAPIESEIWGYLPSLRDSFKRDMYSSVNLRLAPTADVKSVLDQIKGPAIDMNGMTEADYWREQSKLMRVYLTIAYTLVGIMCVAAVFAIANTMFSAVAGRTREIAMLRTIGYSGRQILSGFVIESVLLAIIGGALGIALCETWLLFVGHQKDMYGSNTFTTMAFNIALSPRIGITALLGVAIVGAAGALFPARRAARLDVITALREA